MRRLILIAAIGAISGLAYLLGWSNVFPVKSIEIAESDQSIVKEVSARLNQFPAPVVIGEPMARVDKREITSRLRTLIWVEDVQVRRSFLSGKVSISVSPRSAIAQLDSRWSANPNELGFLGSDLEFFFVPQSEVAKAAKSGDADWLSLPNLSLGSSDRALIEDVAGLMAALPGIGAEIRSVTAPNRESIKTLIGYNERELDISWGSVKELELKFEVMARLLELKANRNVKRIDLSAPLAPIVSNS
ncbi:MAG: FtsQ-type POTRA domain-containing protein [Candidatus Nanopelagicaceae bacterium]|nr:FtsQ-type POTRA domain-containing protein [Candidatus Nanopelagicaceae bacterium]